MNFAIWVDKLLNHVKHWVTFLSCPVHITVFQTSISGEHYSPSASACLLPWHLIQCVEMLINHPEQVTKFGGLPGSCRPRWAPYWPHEPCYQVIKLLAFCELRFHPSDGVKVYVCGLMYHKQANIKFKCCKNDILLNLIVQPTLCKR